MPVAIFFFEAERAVLETAADADIEAAVVSRTSGPKAVEKRTGRGATDGVDPEGDGCRVRNPLVRQAGPPALWADIPGHWIGTAHPSELRVRLGTYQRHSQRCASAEQIATFHPLPPAAKYACVDGRSDDADRSSLSTIPMANGFHLNEPAYRAIPSRRTASVTFVQQFAGGSYYLLDNY